MNYETRIYLDKLIEAVGELNSPDWWTIGITVVNVFIMAWLACRQVKLQKQQNAMQQRQLQLEKFNIQREIYRNLYMLSLDSRIVLPLVYEYFVMGSTELILSRFDKYNVDFEKLARKIEINEADYLLQYGENDLIIDARCFADAISFIFGKVASIHLDPHNNTVSIFERIQARNNKWSDAEWIENIRKKWPDENLISMLEFFVKEKHRLFEGDNSVLSDIREKYITDK